MHKLILAIVFSLVLPSMTSAAYDRRPAELKTQLEDLLKAGTISLAEKQALEKGLAQYFTVREQSFRTLAEIVQKTDTDKLESKWVDMVNATMIDMTNYLANALKDFDTKGKSVQAIVFQLRVQKEEQDMLAALRTANVVQKRDFIIENQRRVKEMISALDRKWEELLNVDGRYDEIEANAYKAVREAINDVGKQLAQNEISSREAILRWIANNKQLVEMVGTKAITWTAALKDSANADAYKEFANIIMQQFTKGIELHLLFNGKFDQHLNEYRNAFDAERGGPFIIFKGIRKDTETFVRENNFKLAKEAYEQASSMLTTATSNRTQGQKGDLDDFSKELLSRLTNHLSQTESMHNEFVKKHETKFFGLLGPDIKEALLEIRTWENNRRELEAIDLDTLLRRWWRGPKYIFEIAGDDLPDEIKNNVISGIQAKADDLRKYAEEERKKKQALQELMQLHVISQRDLE